MLIVRSRWLRKTTLNAHRWLACLDLAPGSIAGDQGIENSGLPVIPPWPLLLEKPRPGVAPPVFTGAGSARSCVPDPQRIEAQDFLVARTRRRSESVRADGISRASLPNHLLVSCPCFLRNPYRCIFLTVCLENG